MPTALAQVGSLAPGAEKVEGRFDPNATRPLQRPWNTASRRNWRKTVYYAHQLGTYGGGQISRATILPFDAPPRARYNLPRAHPKGRCACRSTNTSAGSADDALRKSRNSPILHLPPVNNLVENWSACCHRRLSSSRVPAGTSRTTRGDLLPPAPVLPQILPMEQARRLRSPASRVNLSSPAPARTESFPCPHHVKAGVT